MASFPISEPWKKQSSTSLFPDADPARDEFASPSSLDPPLVTLDEDPTYTVWQFHETQTTDSDSIPEVAIEILSDYTPFPFFGESVGSRFF